MPAARVRWDEQLDLVRNQKKSHVVVVRAAESARMAAISDAITAFDRRPVPKSLDADRSTTRTAVSSLSSMCCLMNGRPRRAVTFQSIDRMSSPGWYSRTSANSRPRPLNTEWYSPLNRDSTNPLVRSSNRFTCCATSGEKTWESAIMETERPPARAGRLRRPRLPGHRPRTWFSSGVVARGGPSPSRRRAERSSGPAGTPAPGKSASGKS